MIDQILSRLDGVRRSGKGWIASCPAHDDQNPSLSVAEGEDGTILLHCFKGCSTKGICEALGIKLNQLFPDSKQMSTEQKRHYESIKKQGTQNVISQN